MLSFTLLLLFLLFLAFSLGKWALEFKSWIGILGPSFACCPTSYQSFPFVDTVSSSVKRRESPNIQHWENGVGILTKNLSGTQQALSTWRVICNVLMLGDGTRSMECALLLYWRCLWQTSLITPVCAPVQPGCGFRIILQAANPSPLELQGAWSSVPPFFFF